MFQKCAFSGSHEPLPSPFWHSRSASLRSVPLLSEGSEAEIHRKSQGMKRFLPSLIRKALSKPHCHQCCAPKDPPAHAGLLNSLWCSSKLSQNCLCCVTAQALLPLSLSPPSLTIEKCAGVTAKAAHTHSHADRQAASTNPKEDFKHQPLLLLPHLSTALPSSFAHEWGCCRSAGPRLPCWPHNEANA